jgi:four helix bundle protein
MTEKDMLQRTKAFALRIMKLVDALPKTAAGKAISAQLVRSGTSVSANYRAACRGRSKAEFVAKLGVVEEEADESAHWLELIMEGGLLREELVQDLHKEACEITAMMSASKITARARMRSQIANRNSQIK